MTSACVYSSDHGPISHIHSLVRFWGWTENAAEVAKDQQEMSQRLAEGKPLYGESHMPQHVQDHSARNSRFAQLKFSKYSASLVK